MVKRGSRADLSRALKTFDLILNAAIGFTWGPLLWYLCVHVADWSHPWPVVAMFAATIGLCWVTSRVPDGWFVLRDWERRGRGQFYVRWMRIRGFKSWMSHGDRMNAWLRRRDPQYRVVRPTREAAAVYAARTIESERPHLAWLVGALAPTVYAAMRGAWEFVALWTLANIVTNVWPIALQRYHRVRVERVLSR